MGTRGRGDQTWDLGEEAQEREAGGPEGGNGIWDPEHLGHGLGQAAEASRAVGAPGFHRELPGALSFPSHSLGCLERVFPQS